jgi:hypothetical protein
MDGKKRVQVVRGVLRVLRWKKTTIAPTDIRVRAITCASERPPIKTGLGRKNSTKKRSRDINTR